MNKPLQNYVLDWTSLVLLAALASTGMLMGYALPPGSRGATLLGLDRHDWGEVHLWIAWGFLAVVVLHLILHAAWIKMLTLGKSTGRARTVRGAVAIGAAVVLVGLVVLGGLAPAPVAGTGGDHEGPGWRRGAMADEEEADEEEDDDDRPRRGQRW